MDQAQQKWQFDWKQVGDYLLGRSTLIGIASMMLLTISAYATWHGMRDFIMGVSGEAPEAGGSSIPNDLLVIMVVVALTFLMWLALRETFGSHRRLIERFITIPLYVFLALWSIGFGYGFWWSLIAGQDATRSGLAGLARRCPRRQLGRCRPSRRRARSARHGGHLVRKPNGPRGKQRWQLRYDVRRRTRTRSTMRAAAFANSVTSLRDGMISGWLNPVQADVDRLKQTGDVG